MNIPALFLLILSLSIFLLSVLLFNYNPGKKLNLPYWWPSSNNTNNLPPLSNAEMQELKDIRFILYHLSDNENWLLFVPSELEKIEPLLTKRYMGLMKRRILGGLSDI